MAVRVEEETRSFFRVSDVARALGCSADTVRRYEEIGLIPQAQRHVFNGARYWTRLQVEKMLAQVGLAPATRGENP